MEGGGGTLGSLDFFLFMVDALYFLRVFSCDVSTKYHTWCIGCLCRLCSLVVSSAAVPIDRQPAGLFFYFLSKRKSVFFRWSPPSPVKFSQVFSCNATFQHVMITAVLSYYLPNKPSARVTYLTVFSHILNPDIPTWRVVPKTFQRTPLLLVQEGLLFFNDVLPDASLSLPASSSLSLVVPVSLHLSVCLSVSVSFALTLSLSVCRSNSVSLFLCLCLSISLS